MNATTVLVLSFKKDIQFLDNLINEITTERELTRPNSWIFPRKTASNSYEYSLEILLDQLSSFLHLIVQFTNKYLQKQSKHTKIVQPEKFTVGVSVKLVWDNIVQIINNKEIYVENIKKSSDISKSVEMQTEETSRQNCDSCVSAINCMKRLMKSVENNGNKCKIQYNIYDITQFGCMLRVTSSIEEALHNLFKQLTEKQMETVNLQGQFNELSQSFKDKESKNKILQEEIQILKKKLKQDNQEMLAIKHEQDSLAKDNENKNSTITELRKSIASYNTEFYTLKQEITTSKKDNIRLKTSIQKCLDLFSKTNYIVNIKIKNLNKEHEIIKAILDQYDLAIESLNKKSIRILKNCGKIELKVASGLEINKQMSTICTKSNKFVNSIPQMFNEKITAVKEKEAEVIIEDKIIKGNPVEDITSQIEVNKTRIQELENENIKLQTLLDKFKLIQCKK